MTEKTEDLKKDMEHLVRLCWKKIEDELARQYEAEQQADFKTSNLPFNL